MELSLEEIDRRLRESRAEAERWLPHLLELSGLRLTRELARRPELQPGLAQVLLDRIDDAVDRAPARAYELTTAVVACAGLPGHVRGCAWTSHADALRALGRYGEAHDAIETALGLFGRGVGSSWFTAAADVVAARILYEEGAGEEALRRIRRAAEVFLLYGAVDRSVAARMLEAWMQWDRGHEAAAAQVWRDAGRDALERGGVVAMAFLESRMGTFLLRHDRAEEAARCFANARKRFETSGHSREALRARWGLAEAAAARGELDHAVAELGAVQAGMLGTGDLGDAAIASIAILELLLAAGRDAELLPLAERIVARFTEAGLTLNALRAWTFVRRRARTGGLTAEDLATVRAYFERLPLRPNARFDPPEAHR
jgi:ATP/maltotriose-dependent transcriptional regulator MalT